MLDGRRIADSLLDELRLRVDARVAAGRLRPTLAVVLVGQDPASQSYVRNKRRAAEKVGIQAFDFDLPVGTTEAELIALIDRLNADPAVHGILIQLPLGLIAALTDWRPVAITDVPWMLVAGVGALAAHFCQAQALKRLDASILIPIDFLRVPMAAVEAAGASLAADLLPTLVRPEMQARIDAGDERYLSERDRGEVRGFVRDWVDSKRFFNNYVMPAALVLLVIMLIGTWLPRVSAVLSLLSLLFMLTIFIEGFIIGSRANRAVRAKFPDADTGFGIGMYAFSRATQPRNWRTPKPRVAVGAKV